MNKTVTSLVALGIGTMVYRQAKKNNYNLGDVMDNRTVKQMQKGMRRVMRNF
ncbi:DUF3918 family protein [Radiobacillus sp. PE A8.2]|uniref:DUF3918 family protein n=1 Tax=Radiobacillus sp. PE A8.2 TaxID=3380349 RepID=UPI00388DB8D5